MDGVDAARTGRVGRLEVDRAPRVRWEVGRDQLEILASASCARENGCSAPARFAWRYASRWAGSWGSARSGGSGSTPGGVVSSHGGLTTWRSGIVMSLRGTGLVALGSPAFVVYVRG